MTNLQNFSHYLAGLIEGDGSIVVPVKRYSDKGRKRYPSIQICFHAKDFPLALTILQNLKHGSLAKKRGKNAYVLSVNNMSGIERVISLIRGKMRTPKVEALQRLINWVVEDKRLSKREMGTIGEAVIEELQHVALDTSPLLSNA